MLDKMKKELEILQAINSLRDEIDIIKEKIEFAKIELEKERLIKINKVNEQILKKYLKIIKKGTSNL